MKNLLALNPKTAIGFGQIFAKALSSCTLGFAEVNVVSGDILGKFYVKQGNLKGKVSSFSLGKVLGIIWKFL
jgi:hypothetical protein